jgi:broad specificity phosphatase PhoE
LEPIHDINAFSDNAITRYHEALVTQLQRMHQDDVVLIVGHSNSLPSLLQTLGHPEPIAIASEEYDNLFVVIPRLGGPPSVLRFRF